MESECIDQVVEGMVKPVAPYRFSRMRQFSQTSVVQTMTLSIGPTQGLSRWPSGTQLRRLVMEGTSLVGGADLPLFAAIGHPHHCPAPMGRLRRTMCAISGLRQFAPDGRIVARAFSAGAICISLLSCVRTVCGCLLYGCPRRACANSVRGRLCDGWLRRVLRYWRPPTLRLLLLHIPF